MSKYSVEFAGKYGCGDEIEFAVVEVISYSIMGIV